MEACLFKPALFFFFYHVSADRQATNRSLLTHTSESSKTQETVLLFAYRNYATGAVRVCKCVSAVSFSFKSHGEIDGWKINIYIYSTLPQSWITVKLVLKLSVPLQTSGGYFGNPGLQKEKKKIFFLCVVARQVKALLVGGFVNMHL